MGNGDCGINDSRSPAPFFNEGFDFVRVDGN